MLTVQKYECNTGCLVGSIMQYMCCDKKVWRIGKYFLVKEYCNTQSHTFRTGKLQLSRERCEHSHS